MPSIPELIGWWSKVRVPSLAELYGRRIAKKVWAELRHDWERPEWTYRFDRPPVDVDETYLESLTEPESRFDKATGTIHLIHKQ